MKLIWVSYDLVSHAKPHDSNQRVSGIPGAVHTLSFSRWLPLIHYLVVFFTRCSEAVPID